VRLLIKIVSQHFAGVQDTGREEYQSWTRRRTVVETGCRAQSLASGFLSNQPGAHHWVYFSFYWFLFIVFLQTKLKVSEPLG